MENTEQGKETSKVETEVADLRDQGRAHRTSRGQGPVPRGHRATCPGSAWRTQASRLTGGWPANPNRRHVSCRATPAPRRLAAAVWVKARLLSRPGSVRGAGGARPPLDGEHPRGASLTQGPAPRFSFNCSGDCRRQQEAAGRTGVVVSCLDSNLGFSICHLHELKHSIILLGHRFLHV